MDILMVNPVHPATPHISAARAWRFAQELSALGHRVVLLTRPLQPDGATPMPELATHDWAGPFVLECAGVTATSSTRVGGRLRSKLRTAVGLLRHGGSDGQWHDEALRRILDLVATGTFRPDVAWATFGKGEALFVARKAAQGIGCPWVMDIKDNWELYVPTGLRRLLAWRVRGWSKATANAQLTAACVSTWHGATAQIVYSGVDHAFLAHPTTNAVPGAFILNLVGSVYSRQEVERFFRGIGHWLAALGDRARDVEVHYYGGDVEMVAGVAAEVLPGACVKTHGFASIDQFGKACASASANAYLAYSKGFHHKLLELLSTGVPTITMPGETVESMSLVESYGTPFHVVADEIELAKCLEELFQRHIANDCPLPRVSGLDRHSWPNQARQLESILIAATHKDSP